MADEEFLTVLLSVITSGTLTALVTTWMNRHKTRAEAASIEEQADATGIGSLLHIIETLQTQYDGLAKRFDDEKARNDRASRLNLDLQTELQRVADEAERAIGNLRDELAEERKQRKVQTELIIELSDKVNQQQGLIEAQAATISSLRTDLTASEKANSDLKRDLASERRERLLLAAQLEVKQRK